MRILVYGAGVIGSICAFRLRGAGHDVTLLARGDRLEDLRVNGLRLVEYDTEKMTSLSVPLVDSLGPEDAYDIVFVVMQRQQALEVLPILARNKKVPTFLFIGNCAGGSREYVRALGAGRVLLGFVLSGGYVDGGVVHYGVRKGGVIPVYVGSPREAECPMQDEVASLLKSSFGQVEVSQSMEGWLFTHAATIVPLACALYASGEDSLRLSRTRDAIVIGLRGSRELIGAQKKLGLPVLPPSLRSAMGYPEPILVYQLSRAVRNSEFIFGMRHAYTARVEMRFLANELSVAARTAGASTPNFEMITGWLDKTRKPLVDGSNALRLDWRGIYAAALGATAILALLTFWFLR